MAASTQSSLFRNLSYSNEISNQIITSGGTIVFMKDNVIMATEVSEAQYRELLNSPYIEKMDVLPLKRYKNECIKYIETDPLSNTALSTINNVKK